ncbi:hypothetical protein D3C76_1816990 [compost metagenome]
MLLVSEALQVGPDNARVQSKEHANVAVANDFFVDDLLVAQIIYPGTAISFIRPHQ